MRPTRQREILPLTIRKHSDIVAARAVLTPVLGEKHKTDYGFFINGFSNKSFETKYVTVVQGAATPTWSHAKKTRTFRVIAGAGQVITEDNNVTEIIPIVPGTEFVAVPGVKYKISTNRNSPHLELFVSQDYKYEASLVEHDESITPAVFPDGVLLPTSLEEPRRRRNTNSKAVEQSLLLAGASATRTVDYAQAHQDLHGVNIKPIDPRTLE